MSSSQRLKRLKVIARRQGRLDRPSSKGGSYVVGAIDPLTGRRQGPNIDDYTAGQRELDGIPPGVTNAKYRAFVRKELAKCGLPPVGHLDELTKEEYEKLCRIKDWDHKRDLWDMPCNSWQLTANQQTKCAYWHCEVRRGAMTREEYHRLALEMAGLPPKVPPAVTESEPPVMGGAGN